jgi:hypothetical protein
MRVVGGVSGGGMGISSLGLCVSGRQAGSGTIGDSFADPALLGWFVAEMVDGTGQLHIWDGLFVRVCFRANVLGPMGILHGLEVGADCLWVMTRACLGTVGFIWPWGEVAKRGRAGR